MLLYDQNKIVLIQLGNNHNTVNCYDRSMNFVHFRIFTLLSKDFEKESTNHENAISELETGIWNWKLEIEQKHKLEVVNYITADTTMKSNRLHSGKECLSKHSYFENSSRLLLSSICS